MSPAATQAYRNAKAALHDARGWVSVRLPPFSSGAEREVLDAARHLAVCVLLVEAEHQRAKARRARAVRQ